jgi:feruloyl esterase
MLFVGNAGERISPVLITGTLAFLLSIPAPAQTAPPDAVKTAPCASLAGFAIPAKEFQLPTGGAQVEGASPMDVTGAAYCRVTGTIAPATQGSPVIKFQVNLPANWNGKAVQFGGGGYDGNIPNAAGRTTSGLRDAPVPLAQGYMTFSDDSGHQAKDGNDASFAVNEEARLNFAWMHIGKAKDAAFAIATRFYGRTPRRLYFSGGSTGGREALTAATRWPKDYAGVSANYPTANFTGLRLWGAKLANVLYANHSAGWIAPAVVEHIAKAGLEACDELDGARDGIVSNMAACHASAQERLRALSCPPGDKGAEGCLTAAQLKTIAVYHEGYKPGPAVASLLPSFGGYNILEGAAMNLGTDPAAHEPIADRFNAHHAARADQFLKYFIARDPQFTLNAFDVDAAGTWAQRVAELTPLINDTAAQLEAYEKAGGKILLVQGADDVSVSPEQNTQLYLSVRKELGAARTDAFMRFYLVPGLGHGIGTFLLSWDNLGILDRWADQGIAPPAEAVGWDGNAGANRSRPVCAYPAWPKYKGTGSISEASSFTCSTASR